MSANDLFINFYALFFKKSMSVIVCVLLEEFVQFCPFLVCIFFITFSLSSVKIKLTVHGA